MGQAHNRLIDGPNPKPRTWYSVGKSWPEDLKEVLIEPPVTSSILHK